MGLWQGLTWSGPAHAGPPGQVVRGGRLVGREQPALLEAVDQDRFGAQQTSSAYGFMPSIRIVPSTPSHTLVVSPVWQQSPVVHWRGRNAKLLALESV